MWTHTEGIYTGHYSLQLRDAGSEDLNRLKEAIRPQMWAFSKATVSNSHWSSSLGLFSLSIHRFTSQTIHCSNICTLFPSQTFLSIYSFWVFLYCVMPCQKDWCRGWWVQYIKPTRNCFSISIPVYCGILIILAISNSLSGPRTDDRGHKTVSLL